jgi:Cupin-like domain
MAHPGSPREFSGLDDESVRRQVLSEERPAVIRGLVDHWAAVREGRASPDALIRYFKQFDAGRPVDALLMRPEVGGQLSYNETMTGFNFVRNRLPLTEIAEQVLRYAKFSNAPSVAAQSALIRDCLPGFEEHNRLGALPSKVQPRIWLGNRISTPTHVDEWSNIGCVVAGRRRFTLFPPDQISNLYIGPLDFAPTGAAMSLVSLRSPDFEKFPRFRDALGAAQVADLGPGDAIYIPPLWWHHVESLDPFNVLVNYWWREAAWPDESEDSAFDALLHGILSIRKLPPATRRAWAAFFEHYVFAASDDAVRHIPAARHGILGDLTVEQLAALRDHLMKRLQDSSHRR